MPQVHATLEYLQQLALYETEKPYWCFLAPREGFDPDVQRVDNLEFEDHENITIKDIRETGKRFDLNDCGFQVISHQSRFSGFEQAADVQGYRSETERLLEDKLGAVYAKCYDTVLRKNVAFQRNQLDLADPLHTEGPARGVHNGPNPYNLSHSIIADGNRYHIRVWTCRDQSILIGRRQEEVLET